MSAGAATAAFAGNASGGRGANGGAAPVQGGNGAMAGGGTNTSGFPACESGEPAAEPAPVLGLESGTRTPFEGTVSAVAERSLLIDAAGGQEAFAWQGPSLVDRFTVGASVTVTFPPAGGGLTPSHWVLVTSSEAQAATLIARIYSMAATETGATYTIPLPQGFPDVKLVNRGCCNPGIGLGCDYSALQVTIEGHKVTHDRSEPVAIGDWWVTNLYAIYSQGGEYVMNASLTMLGPAAE